MDTQVVAELMRMMEQSNLTVLEVEQNGLRVYLENGSGTGTVAAPSVHQEPRPMPIADVIPVVEIIENDSAELPDGKTIASPMVGVYHELKNKIKAGTKLKKGDPICVIEAMKVMNEILMEEDGEVSFVAVTEGEMVEYGQTLFLYR